APTSPGRAALRDLPTAERSRRIAYAPNPDGGADPGEVVWAWVPFEEHDGRGKDRPLLVVGRDDDASRAFGWKARCCPGSGSIGWRASYGTASAGADLRRGRPSDRGSAVDCTRPRPAARL
ncbi:MAG: hypothetical protein QOE32_7571, partial [Pseudonocardiales bacterium]|nr:hypothetical protein [Pseudonocardiales bacterium]